jgi:2-iminobutanoate/2-iminopropanoate deaminase
VFPQTHSSTDEIGEIMSKKFINPSTMFPSVEFGFSQMAALQGGTFVFLSGQPPFGNEGQIVGSTRKEQMRQCLRNINIALEAAGGTLADIVFLRIYMVDYDPDTDSPVITQVLKEFFPGETPPATTWLGVSSLALKDFIIELEAVAVLQ